MSRYTAATLAAAMLFAVGLAGNTACAQSLTIALVPTPTADGGTMDGSLQLTITSTGLSGLADSWWTAIMPKDGDNACPQVTTSSQRPVAIGYTSQMDFQSIGGSQVRVFGGLQNAVTYCVLVTNLVDATAYQEVADATTTGPAEPAPTAQVTATAISASPGDTVRLAATAQLPAGSSASAPTYAWTCMRPEVTQPTDSTLAQPAMVTLTGADLATATFTAPALTDAATPPNTATEITIACQVAISGPGGNAAGSPFMVTVTIAPATGGDADDNAILPNVLRNITNGIHGGIFNRIQQRQREDGQWQ